MWRRPHTRAGAWRLPMRMRLKLDRWAMLAPIKRYALFKPAHGQSDRNWRAALAEFKRVEA